VTTHRYLNGLGLGEVAELSGAKPDTINHWILRGHLDCPPSWGRLRDFGPEHVLQVLFMKRLVDSGIRGKKAGAEARRMAREGMRRIEVDGLPVELQGRFVGL
jgi:MerR HTH family regulatory protein